MAFYLTLAPAETSAMKVYRLGEGVPLLVGRELQADIHLTSQSVSRRHCHIWVHGSRVWIRDLGSSNGTWRGNDRLTLRREPYEMRVGESLRLGPYQLVLSTSPGVPQAAWEESKDPLFLLNFCRTPGTQRKLRLFACACSRDVWSHLSDKTPRHVVEMAERYADDETSRTALEQAHDDSLALTATAVRSEQEVVGAATATAAPSAEQAVQHCWRLLLRYGKIDVERACAFARDLFGDVFETFEVPLAWRRWQNGLLVQMAEAIYRERTFDEMPILADALEDVGCTNSAILDHCRNAPVHARGCWVLDALRERM